MFTSSSSSFTCTKLSALILVSVLLQILGLSLFVIGFFPVKPTLHGKSGLESYTKPTCNPTFDSEERDLPPDQLRSLYTEHSNIPPVFDRLILMVVDGLPAEFLLGRGNKPPSKALMEAMPYTQSLLSDGRAIGYHAKAAPPTVTMPRIKAMVSGAIGGFLDVAFNFNTQAFLDDNLLDQLYRIGWKMVMFGDETWIKLFPKLYTRQDGVSSFYVKDTVEVDFNVSRNLDIELSSADWNLMILHYLGLDHVGHIGGRHSILMAPKLKEMDEVIKMIHMQNILHQDFSDQRTLLVVVSDHGMTSGGNHGGSSYEETDSLSLFIGGDGMISDNPSSAHNEAYQVDLAPTLSLLLGVPIPKNNIGVLFKEVLSSLPDKQRLRALELNSWQLLRLLQAHLPGLLCANLSYSRSGDCDSQLNITVNNAHERLYHLFLRASCAHNLWEQRQLGSDFMINNSDEFKVLITSYYEFLRNASEWLSHKATDKPVNLLLSGIALMVVSCFLLLYLLGCLYKEFLSREMQCHSLMNEYSHSWQWENVFVSLGILIHDLSLGSSSLVEEEQYTWNFLVSTLYLIFLGRAVQCVLNQRSSGPREVLEGRERKVSALLHKDACTHERQTKDIQDYKQIMAITVSLLCGRLLRGWHQGGVNWVHFPDISKWLEQADISTIKSLQIISLLLVVILYSFSIRLLRSRTILVDLVNYSHLVSGLLVFLYIIVNLTHSVSISSLSSTSIAQTFYLIISMTAVITVLASPWVLPVVDYRIHLVTKPNEDSHSKKAQIGSSLMGIRDESLMVSIREAMYLIGMNYAASWCLLQILLQQPINSVPILLIFLQLSASIFYFSADGSSHRQWTEVAAIYLLGMTGHFGLGNSNSLATVDVAGAFIGISSYSTVLSGILMFIITYASPLLAFLVMVLYISTKNARQSLGQNKLELGCILQLMIAFPCLLPLAFNSIVLTTFTIILLLMRDHLFVWSVFSPKYLYICGMTVSVYIGTFVIAATGVYVCTIFFIRRKMLLQKVGTSSG